MDWGLRAEAPRGQALGKACDRMVFGYVVRLYAETRLQRTDATNSSGDDLHHLIYAGT